MPVAGQLLRGFGAAEEGGGTARGLTWQATPGARVVSPCAGRVAFAAPFRSYGQLVILDCGEGQHFVLAGLGRLDVAAGQRVLAGEPVGQLAVEAGRARPTLYGELRLRGQPVDPGPWLSGRGG
ncbi:MAG: peptidoglycan DD-metalloendopeptidase family protein [Acetobacteraceae bacterium]|nr:peptidoglycan DD-metalloendopeptidase family protein [Acetobacteraceae bacterium]